MEEQNNQNLENQESEANKNVEVNVVNEKKSLPKNIKMAIIISAAVIAIVAIALVLIFVVFKHRHNWGAWEMTQDATCTKSGIATQHCSGCDEINEYVLEIKSHSFGEWVETVKGDCITDGIKVRVCSACGKEETNIETARGSHTFPWEWTVIIEPTCTTDGMREHKCFYCDKTEAEATPASHDYSDGICTKCNKGLISIILPNTPITVHDLNYNGSIDVICKITSISIVEIRKRYSNNSNNEYALNFTWSGEKTYDDDGNNYSSSVGFGYKIYDSEGYVIYSGTARSQSVAVGEKFRDQEFGPYSYVVLDPNETYTLEILNLD